VSQFWDNCSLAFSFVGRMWTQEGNSYGYVQVHTRSFTRVSQDLEKRLYRAGACRSTCRARTSHSARFFVLLPRVDPDTVPLRLVAFCLPSGMDFAHLRKTEVIKKRKNSILQLSSSLAVRGNYYAANGLSMEKGSLEVKPTESCHHGLVVMRGLTSA
jgi:hypothetical protein